MFVRMCFSVSYDDTDDDDDDDDDNDDDDQCMKTVYTLKL